MISKDFPEKSNERIARQLLAKGAPTVERGGSCYKCFRTSFISSYLTILTSKKLSK